MMRFSILLLSALFLFSIPVTAYDIYDDYGNIVSSSPASEVVTPILDAVDFFGITTPDVVSESEKSSEEFESISGSAASATSSVFNFPMEEVEEPVEVSESVEASSSEESFYNVPSSESEVMLLSLIDDSNTDIVDNYDVSSAAVSSVIVSDDGVTHLVETIFGEYTPLTDGDGISSVNWAWISDVVIFALLLYCALRILGGVIRND